VPRRIEGVSVRPLDKRKVLGIAVDIEWFEEVIGSRWTRMDTSMRNDRISIIRPSHRTRLNGIAFRQSGKDRHAGVSAGRFQYRPTRYARVRIRRGRLILCRYPGSRPDLTGAYRRAHHCCRTH
jgi:hypothetical protein